MNFGLPGTYVYQSEDVRVVVNESGKVITVVPRKEIIWHTSSDDIDTSNFSLDDLYFATV